MVEHFAFNIIAPNINQHVDIFKFSIPVGNLIDGFFNQAKNLFPVVAKDNYDSIPFLTSQYHKLSLLEIIAANILITLASWCYMFFG